MIKTYYLQMLAPPPRPAVAAPEGVTVVQAQSPPVRYYRYLYEAVGSDYNWHSRKRLSDEQLAGFLQHPAWEVHVLMVRGVPAGFAELDRRSGNEVELVQFGLLPEFIGRGLGKHFIHWTVDRVWSYRPSRFWLHTCTEDHRAALPNYLKAGFAVYREEEK